MGISTIIALVIAAVIGVMGMTIKSQHSLNEAAVAEKKLAEGQRDALKQQYEELTRSVALVKADCQKAVESVQSVAVGDAQRAAAAKAALAQQRKTSAAQKDIIDKLSKASTDTTPYPVDLDCQQAKAILKSYGAQVLK